MSANLCDSIFTREKISSPSGIYSRQLPFTRAKSNRITFRFTSLCLLFGFEPVSSRCWFILYIFLPPQIIQKIFIFSFFFFVKSPRKSRFNQSLLQRTFYLFPQRKFTVQWAGRIFESRFNLFRQLPLDVFLRRLFSFQCFNLIFSECYSNRKYMKPCIIAVSR